MMVGMATMIDRRKFVSAMAIAPFAARAWAKETMSKEHLLFV
jgi:hypothetical protein